MVEICEEDMNELWRLCVTCRRPPAKLKYRACSHAGCVLCIQSTSSMWYFVLPSEVTKMLNEHCLYGLVGSVWGNSDTSGRGERSLYQRHIITQHPLVFNNISEYNSFYLMNYSFDSSACVIIGLPEGENVRWTCHSQIEPVFFCFNRTVNNKGLSLYKTREMPCVKF